METKEEIDLCAVVWMRVCEFTEKYNLQPNRLILPLFFKEHLIYKMWDFGNTKLHKDGFIFMGLKVHWTTCENPNSIQVFEALN